MQEKIQAGFSPLLPNFVASPFNDVVALEQILEKEKIGAIPFANAFAKVKISGSKSKCSKANNFPVRPIPV